MTTESDNEKLNRREAAKYLGVSLSTLVAWAHKGKPYIPFFRYNGGKVYYLKSELNRFIIMSTSLPSNLNIPK